MNRLSLVLAASLLGVLPAAAQPAATQAAAPEIAFDSVANALTLPDDIYLGEIGGVATNSKGDIFVYTRTGHPTLSIGSARGFVHGGSRLFQFDRNGKFVREIGKDSYAFVFAQMVRIDPQDNIWTVDQMTNSVIKFDPEGRVLMILGRKPESVFVPVRAPGRRPTSSTARPTSPGTAPATPTSPTVSATSASPSSTRTASSSSPGARGAMNRASSALRAPSRSTPRTTSMSPIRATAASRCSTATETSSGRSLASGRRRHCASRRGRTRCSTARIPIRPKTSTPAAKSTSSSSTAR
jgi:hypothetical protein